MSHFLFGSALMILVGLQAANAAIYMVTTNTDNPGGVDPPPGAGTGTLRQAIVDANFLTPGANDVITFNIAPGGFQSIQPFVQLPELTDPAGVTIDGFTQPGGASAGANPPLTATLLIEINGSMCISGPPLFTCHGLVIRSPNNIIRGLIINNFKQDGILVRPTPTGTFNNMIYCNFIGTDPTGTLIQWNGQDMTQLWAGVYIGALNAGTAYNNTVSSNLVSGNYAEGVGIMSCPPAVDVYSNQVIHNYIGTDKTGIVPMGNIHDGVYIGEGAHHNLVANNLINFNGFEGVCIVGYPPNGWNSHHNTVTNNTIAANNSDGVNIGIYGANSLPSPWYQGGYAAHNTIGPGNLIQNNNRNGVCVWEFSDPLWANTDDNKITQNQILNNLLLGIDLQDNGVTLNDPLDPDCRANQELNFPVITGAVLYNGQTTLSGTLGIDSNPATALIELFKLNFPDPSGFGEGDTYLTQTTPLVNGNWTVTVPGVPAGTPISATATDANSNTSEFSATVVVTNTVSITIGTVPPGLNVMVDGIQYTSPATFAWVPATTHSIAAPSPQVTAPGVRQAFASWSDGGAQSHVITTGLAAAGYTANFVTQYQLTTSVNPSGSGTVSLVPSGPWYNSGDSVTLNALPSSSYLFNNWSGGFSGIQNPVKIAMNAPTGVTANFVAAPINVVSTSPAANAINVDRSENIQVTFDVEIDTATLDSAAFRVYGHLKGNYPGTYSWDSATQTITFQPSVNLSDGEVITVILTSRLKTPAGTSLAPYLFSFTAEASNVTKMAFSRADVILASGAGYITAADFTGDGWTDVAVTRVNEQKVSVMMNSGGTLQSPVSYNTGNSPYEVTAADIENDGDMDLLYIRFNAPLSYIDILKNNGNGTFATPVSYPGAGGLQIACAELNGDGFADVVTSNGYDSLNIFLNNGLGQFNSHIAYLAGGNLHFPFCGDFDNDGDNDIAVLIAPQTNYYVALLLNNGSGVFAAPVYYFVNMGQASALEGADFNGDGFLDLAGVGELGNRVNILMNNGDGTFGTQSEWWLPGRDFPKDMICTDIDGDHDIDLVTCNRLDFGGELSVLLNIGDGRFMYWLSYPAGNIVGRMSFADFDHDGDMDPVVFEDGTNCDVSVFPNTGNATVDFGDAPEPFYPTLLATNGARHVTNTDNWILRFGSLEDAEADGQPNANATGDDLNGTPDDEDGVTFSPPLVAGTQDTVLISHGYAMSGYLNAWIDFNRDGDWDDPGEKIVNDRNITGNAGTEIVPFSIPSYAAGGNAISRFRLSSMAGLFYWGQAPDGEVEDHEVAIARTSALALQNITVPQGMTNCYEASQTITTGGGGTFFRVLTGAQIHLVAGTRISLLPGTSVQNGGNLHAYISSSGSYCSAPLKSGDHKAITGSTPNNPDFQEGSIALKVYPNPTTGTLNIEMPATALTMQTVLEVYGVMGQNILHEDITGQKVHTLSLAGQPEGVYLLRIISGRETVTVKVVKE